MSKKPEVTIPDAPKKGRLVADAGDDSSKVAWVRFHKGHYSQGAIITLKIDHQGKLLSVKFNLPAYSGGYCKAEVPLNMLEQFTLADLVAMAYKV